MDQIKIEQSNAIIYNKTTTLEMFSAVTEVLMSLNVKHVSTATTHLQSKKTYSLHHKIPTILLAMLIRSYIEKNDLNLIAYTTTEGGRVYLNLMTM